MGSFYWSELQFVDVGIEAIGQAVNFILVNFVLVKMPFSLLIWLAFCPEIRSG